VSLIDIRSCLLLLLSAVTFKVTCRARPAELFPAIESSGQKLKRDVAPAPVYWPQVSHQEAREQEGSSVLTSDQPVWTQLSQPRHWKT